MADFSTALLEGGAFVAMILSFGLAVVLINTVHVDRLNGDNQHLEHSRAIGIICAIVLGCALGIGLVRFTGVML